MKKHCPIFLFLSLSFSLSFFLFLFLYILCPNRGSHGYLGDPSNTPLSAVILLHSNRFRQMMSTVYPTYANINLTFPLSASSPRVSLSGERRRYNFSTFQSSQL